MHTLLEKESSSPFRALGLKVDNLTRDREKSQFSRVVGVNPPIRSTFVDQFCLLVDLIQKASITINVKRKNRPTASQENRVYLHIPDMYVGLRERNLF